MKSPLLALASCFALGIVCARCWRLPSIPFLLASAGVCMLVGLIALGDHPRPAGAGKDRHYESSAGRHTASLALVLAGFVFAGAAAARLFEIRFPPNHISHMAVSGIDLSGPIRLEGYLVSSPLRTSYGLQFDVEATSLEAARLENRGQVHPLMGKVRLRLQLSEDPEVSAAAESLHLRYGDSIRALVRLRRPRIYRNPGSFDFRRWMESIEDLYWVGTIKSPMLVEKLPRPGPPKLANLLERTRYRLLQGIDRLYPPWSAEGRDGAVLKAVLLGDRSSLDSDTIENFRKAGLYHLLVIAGLHVGLLAMLAAMFLRLLPLPELWRSALVLLFLLSYASVVEQRAPTLRATLMISAYLLARLFYRGRTALNAIGFAALVLLLYRPAYLFESGFELSFSAALLIAGLVLPILTRTTEPYRRSLWQLLEVDRDPSFAPRLAQFRLDLRALIAGLKGRFSFLERHPAVAAGAVTGPARIAVWTANMLLFSIILQLGLLLPMAETFHRVTYAGIGLNALAIPVMSVLLGFAVPTAFLSATIPALAAWPAKALAFLMGALFTLTELPNLPSWLSYRVPEPPGWVAWGFVLSIVAAAWALGRHTRIFWSSLVGFGIFATLVSLHPLGPRLPSGVLEVTALDCGGGDALFLVLPDRTTMLVDAGGSRGRSSREGAFQRWRWDPGEDIVSPYLWSRGIKRIGIVALSHVSEEHLGGLAAVVRNFRVGEFWHGANPLTPAYQALLEEVRQQGITERRVAAGDLIVKGTTSIRILWPPGGQPTSAAISNDDSVVMRISNNEAAALLPGDISSKVEKALLSSGVPLKSTLLKVARHGAKASSSPEFLARVSPRAALVTPETGNPIKLPNPETLDRLRATGARILRTDLEGAVTVEMRDSSLSVHSYRTSRAD